MSYGSTYNNHLDMGSSLDDESHLVLEPKTSVSRKLSPYKSIAATVAVGILFFMAATGVFYKKSYGNYALFTKIPPPPTEEDLQYTLHRTGYQPLSYFSNVTTEVTYGIFQDYGSIIEPYAPMTLYVYNPTSSDSTYEYAVCSGDASLDDDDMTSCKKGVYYQNENTHFTKTQCSPYEEYVLKVVEYDADGEKTRSSATKALCLYVRREIRSLTESDLSDTLDAMYQLWALSDEEGQELYGEKFHNSTFFTEAHTFNAAQQDADHIHEGLGFLPQHLKITNMFEEAVQAVNPAVSLPYWDFTIETANDENLVDSFMFTEKTFGSITVSQSDYWGWTYANESLADAAIPDGRWKQIKADLNRYEGLANGFGYLRGPWNTNPSPYISRFVVSETSLPSCSAYYNWLEGDDFLDFLSIAPFGPHASTHGGIGAVYGCDTLESIFHVFADESAVKRTCKKWGIFMKEFYRGNHILPGTDCVVETLDKNGFSCPFQCVESEYDSFLSAIKGQIPSKYMRNNYTDEDYEEIRDFICTGDGSKIFVGDHLEAASPTDPSFWPIHPTMERLFHLKMITGGFEDMTWPTNADDVCDKASCYESKYDDKDYFDECCDGHYEDDQLLDFVNGDRYAGYGLTNKEQMKIGNAGSTDYRLNYIYDGFTWEHCDEDFPSLIEDLMAARRR